MPPNADMEATEKMILIGIDISTGGPGYYAAFQSFFLIIDLVFCPFEEQKLT